MALEVITSEQVIKNIALGSRVFDGGGLYLIAAKTSTRLHGWRFDYTFEGKRKTISLGTYPTVDLKMARERASEARKQVAAGINPSELRKQKRAVIVARLEAERRVSEGLPAIGSFEDVARRWFETRQKDWMESYSSKVIRRLEIHVFPFIGHMPIASIEPIHLLKMCRHIQKKGTIETAHRALEHSSNVFRFGIAETLLKTDPCRDLRGALEKPITTHFSAITKPRPLADLLRAIDGYHGSMVVQSALRLTPMLMLRPGELRKAKWEEIDLETGQFFVSSMRMKRVKQQKESGDPHFVSLPKQAIDILWDLYDLTGRGDFVFPAEGRPGRCMSDGTINAALRSMGYSGDMVTAHGFRATARTLLAEALSIDPAVVELQLAHEVKDANGTAYNRTEYIKKRMTMMQAWADYLDQLRNGTADFSSHAELPEFRPMTVRRRSQEVQQHA